jgi:hypothetical protein
MRNNRPYQEFIDRGYFRVIEQKWTTPEGETKISIKTLVYQKGLDFIRRQREQGGERELAKKLTPEQLRQIRAEKRWKAFLRKFNAMQSRQESADRRASIR